MDNSNFGIRDALGLLIALIVFGLGMKFIPDQIWLSKTVWAIFLIRLAESFFLAILTYIGLAKILIPSDSEVASAARKKAISQGIRAISQKGSVITGLSRNSSRSTEVARVGRTISNIATKLTPDEASPNDQDLFSDLKGSLLEIIKLNNKLDLFQKSLQIVVDLETGASRTDSSNRIRILDNFYTKTLPNMQTAMDNLEIILDSNEISPAEALSNTLDDLLNIDGLIKKETK